MSLKNFKKIILAEGPRAKVPFGYTQLLNQISNQLSLFLQAIKLDMEQQTGSKLRKEYLKAVYCHPAYLTYMQSTSREMLG